MSLQVFRGKTQNLAMSKASPFLYGDRERACEGVDALFQVGVAVEAGAIIADELFALFNGDVSIFDGFAHP